jgi:hypothetical protein
MADKLTETLVDALKQSLTEPGDQRLYRSGKLPGLFAARSGLCLEAATKAIQDGLLEVVRTDAKGKSETEWVRLTPRGVEYLYEHDSPVKVLEEVRDLLRMTREGMPVWLMQMQQDLKACGDKLAEEARAIHRRLDDLGGRIEAALRRADLGRIPLSDGALTIPWAQEALAYLERRRENGTGTPCSFPELFEALRPRHGALTLPAYLDGLRRLHDLRAVQLLPFTDPPEKIPEPEYALADGPALLYYLKR